MASLKSICRTSGLPVLQDCFQETDSGGFREERRLAIDVPPVDWENRVEEVHRVKTKQKIAAAKTFNERCILDRGIVPHWTHYRTEVRPFRPIA